MLGFLLEIIPSKCGKVNDQTVANVIKRFYDIGVYPDWWKLEPLQTRKAWQLVNDIIAQYDPNIQGILVLGLGQTEAHLQASFEIAASYPMVKGFAVGRTIFASVASDYMQGVISDEDAVIQMAQTYQRLCTMWDKARDDANKR